MPRTARARVVLGVSCDFHDAAAALVVDGEVVAAAEEERFTRRKHDRSVPAEAIASCLEVAGLTAAEVDRVVFYEKPLSVLSRYITSRAWQGPRGIPSFARDVPDLVSRNLLVGHRIGVVLRRLGHPKPPLVEFVEHHRSHSAAAFYPSPFAHAAVVTIDGIGEWATATIAHGAGRRITPIEEMRYPDSMGLVYSLLTRWCGFVPNDGEYKLMGLAPYGSPTYREALDGLFAVRPDGSLAVDARAVRWYGDRALRDKKLHGLLGGPPLDPGALIGEREADLAASVQQLCEDVVLGIARRAHDLTSEDALCLAGGVALNCVANGRVLREGPFAQVWVQPAAGDAGSAAGAALAYWHQIEEQPRPARPATADGMSGAALGPRLDADVVAAELDAAGVPHRRVPDLGALADEVAGRIAEGAAVGWFRGRMEFGPRALGQRSILADPRDPDARRRLNLRVKGREGFRPFAPAVLAEHASEWFELDQESPYMLIVAPVRADRLVAVEVEPDSIEERANVARSQIPACTHVDGSARVQTVTEDRHPDLHAVLDAFHERTGCPVLVNTSFNLAGEPIVATVADAVRTATGRLDVLVIEDCIVDCADIGAAADRG